MNIHAKPRWSALALGASLLLGACDSTPPKTPGTDEFQGPTHEKASSAKQRKKISITVYNQNFGLVREIREIDLGTGRVSLEFGDVSGNIQPETVHIKPLGDPNALTVLEQNYRYDLLTPAKLLEKYVGKSMKVYRFNETTGKDDAYDAKLLSAEGGNPVLEIGGEVTYGFKGRFAFPEVPDNLIPEPTLVWLLGSRAAKQTVEITYLTQNLNWSADYVLVVDEHDKLGDLTGWVTLGNTTGTSYENAELKLVAGDVQRVAPDVNEIAQTLAYAKLEDDAGADGFTEEGFFEYHLYTLGRPTSVLDKETKQVTLLEAHGAGIDKRLIFYGQQYWYRGRHGQTQSNQKIGVYLDIQNKESNKLGMPLPAGVVRVYKADSTGAKQFIGEDRIDHTPRDEKIRIKMGDAFDVVGERKQMRWETLGKCASESTWEISLRNHKDTAERVLVYEPVGGDWKILESSHPHEREDAKTFTFDVAVPARGETKITYRVRVRWC